MMKNKYELNMSEIEVGELALKVLSMLKENKASLSQIMVVCEAAKGIAKAKFEQESILMAMATGLQKAFNE